MILLSVGILLSSLLVIPARAAFVWDTNTQRTLGERSLEGPALAYNTAMGKMFMLWIGIDCCNPGHSLNFISSTDMINWSNKHTTSLSAGSAGTCIVGLDMVFDPDNNQMYVIFVQAPLSGGCGTGTTENLIVFHTPDGISLLDQTTLDSSSSGFCSPTIAYNTASRTFAATSCSHLYTSSNGSNWSSAGQIAIGGSVICCSSEIRFITGSYYLTWEDTSNNIHIATSPDLNTWTTISNPAFQTFLRPRLSFYPAEGSVYHLDWQGTNNCGISCGGINDALSSSAQNWGPNNAFQSTQNEPVVVYNPSLQVLLMAWTGTDCCIGGSLNVMQYHFVSGGGGGGGSVAYGSLITLSDGTKVPVQNVPLGAQLIVYNVPTGYHTTATVYQIHTVTVSATLTIHTSAGLPFRADANPHMKLWVLTSAGTVEKPITLIQPGDEIYNYDLGHWVTVTDIISASGGQHTMFDLLTTPSFTNDGLLLEYIANGYPDCTTPCKT